MFEILKLLRDLNLRRAIDWHLEAVDDVTGLGHMVVRIPVDDQDVKMIEDMRSLFADTSIARQRPSGASDEES